MAQAIKLQDLQKVLTLATSSTKKLVEAGVQHKSNFPELLEKYKWPGTRDFNMALIIIALYTYCLKDNNQTLQEIAKNAINKKENTEKGLRSIFGALRHGKGPKIAEYLRQDFTNEAQIALSPYAYDSDDDTRKKVFENGLFKQAYKITPWKINERDVAYCVNLIKGKIKDAKQQAVLNELDATADKLLHERNDTIKKLENKISDLKTKVKLERLKKQKGDFTAADITALEDEIMKSAIPPKPEHLKAKQPAPPVKPRFNYLENMITKMQKIITFKKLKEEFQKENVNINNMKFDKNIAENLQKSIKTIHPQLSSHLFNETVYISAPITNRATKRSLRRVEYIPGTTLKNKLKNFLKNRVKKSDLQSDIMYPPELHDDVLKWLQNEGVSVVYND